MAGEKPLSETSCKTCKPKAKIYYLNDGGGLRLQKVRPDRLRLISGTVGKLGLCDTSAASS